MFIVFKLRPLSVKHFKNRLSFRSRKSNLAGDTVPAPLTFTSRAYLHAQYNPGI